eukprot:366036-Chlamydomonas_euryale.AAC.16
MSLKASGSQGVPSRYAKACSTVIVATTENSRGYLSPLGVRGVPPSVEVLVPCHKHKAQILSFLYLELSCSPRAEPCPYNVFALRVLGAGAYPWVWKRGAAR